MLRILLVLTLLVAIGQSSGVLWLGGDSCSSDDCGDGKQCPPQCPTCTCASAPTPSVPTLRVVITPPVISERVVEFDDTQVFAPSPDPREILHVPRSITT